MSESYCCAMRRHFVLGIVGRRADEPVPTEAADFIVDWTSKPILMTIKYCPFCGRLAGDGTLRVAKES